MTTAEEGRPMRISWWASMTNILASYMDVLRYELAQPAGQQTVEALVHAEILKILVREFPKECVQSEFPIGELFAPLPPKDGESQSTPRQFRADVALFDPTSPTRGNPIAVFELKRDGSASEINDDLYRLAIVSRRLSTTGYFVLAGPPDHLAKLLKSYTLLPRRLHAIVSIELSKFKGQCSLFNLADFGDETAVVHLSLLYGETAAPSEGQAPKQAQADQVDAERIARVLDGEQTRYRYMIFGIASDVARLQDKTDQALMVRIVPAKKPAVQLD